jgi:hypothetical protein
MAFQRGNLCFVMLAAFSLSACTASTSHPSKLTGSVLSSSLPPVTASSSATVEAASTSAPILVIPAESTKASNAGTPTSPPNSSPTAVLPTALSSQDIEAGVRATAQQFYDALNIGFATGNLAVYEGMTSPNCVCRSIAKTLDGIYGKQQRVQGVAATVQSINVVSYISDGASADVRYSISAGKIVDSSGVKISDSPAQPNAHVLMFILRVGNEWLVEQNTRLN